MKYCAGIFILLSVLLLAGCAKQLSPSEHTFRMVAPDQWSGGELAPVPEGTDWWTYFGNAELELIVGEALEANHDLRAAVARIETALQDTIIAGTSLRPDANFTFNRSQQRQNFIGFPILGTEGHVLSTTSTNYNLRVNASWEPDLWGRIRSGETVAVTNTRIRFADLAAARLSLSGQVARTWFTAVEAQRQVDLAEATLESFRFSSERVRVRFQSGLRSALDLRLALAEVARAEALLEQLREPRDRAVRQLESLMGRYPAGDYVLSADLPALPEGLPGGLPAELVHRRPDLVAAELQLVAADARIAQAQADLRPRFSLTSGIGTTSANLVDLIDNNLFVWNFVGNLVRPLFNNGRLKATVARNESQAKEAVAIYESQLLQSYREVESALATEDVLARRERALEEAVLQSSAARTLAEQRYQAGLTGIITVLAAQRTAYNSESQLISIRRMRLDNRVDLHLALGGGFDMDDLPSEIKARRTATLSKGGDE